VRLDLPEHPTYDEDTQGLGIFMKTSRARKIYSFWFFVFLCLAAGLFYAGQKSGLFMSTAQKIARKEYTDAERETFILNALLNVRRAPPKKTVFNTYDPPSSPADIDYSPQEKAIYKFPADITVGFDQSRRTEIFYKSLKKELQTFLPQLKNLTELDIRVVNAADKETENKNNNIQIYLIANDGFTQWVDGKPVFTGHGAGAFTQVFILDDPRMRDDVITFNVLSPFLRGYAYFDQDRHLMHAECYMWTYMEPADRQATMRECLVRALGVVGEIKAEEPFQSPELPDILKRTLSFLYCKEIKGGMHQEDVLEILRNGQCL
jgi:hypothetical protein